MQTSLPDFISRTSFRLLINDAQENVFSLPAPQLVYYAPEHPLAYQRLAALCARTGRLKDAQGFLSTLVRLQPQEPRYGVNLATVLLELKDYPAAICEFERVLQIDPSQPEALNNLARFYLTTRKQLPEALILSRRLVTSEPTAAHYDLLGWALYLNGKTNEAFEACNQAVRRDPDNAAYLERRRRLEQALGAVR